MKDIPGTVPAGDVMQDFGGQCATERVHRTAGSPLVIRRTGPARLVRMGTVGGHATKSVILSTAACVSLT